MKTCTYCGKEYPDDATQCAIDGHALSGGPTEPVAVITPTRSAVSQIDEPAERVWTDRQLRFFEIILICAVAFGGGIVGSVYDLANHLQGRSASSGSTIGILINSLRQLASLALLWYVLNRRSKRFSDIGFHNCTWRDFGWSLPIYLAHIFVTCGFHAMFKYLDWSSSPFHGMVFTANSSAIWIVLIAYTFLDPFFEELIVRAYLMTEVRALTGRVGTAIIVSTLVQTSYHLYQGGPAALAHGAVFLIYSIIYAKTGRIAPVILAHLYWDLFGSAWLFPHL